MIRPLGVGINNKAVCFKADKHTIDKKTGGYSDPLMKWPLRGCAFSNEVGEALRPIIGDIATLSWIPALMYIGADVYDKYKNDQNEYSPNSRRCLKQAVFQGMASVFLPLVAVKAGQNVFSQFGKMTDDKISINVKEKIATTAENFIADGKMRAYDGKDSECVRDFMGRVSNQLDYSKQKRSLKNCLKIFNTDKQEKVNTYAEKTIRDLIKMRKDILKPNTEFKSGKWYSAYVNALKGGQTESVAIKSVLSKYQNSKLMSSKFIKTIGGFVALGIAIKPIDHFVEEILIGKYVGPEIDKLDAHVHAHKDI